MKPERIFVDYEYDNFRYNLMVPKGTKYMNVNGHWINSNNSIIVKTHKFPKFNPDSIKDVEYPVLGIVFNINTGSSLLINCPTDELVIKTNEAIDIESIASIASKPFGLDLDSVHPVIKNGLDRLNNKIDLHLREAHDFYHKTQSMRYHNKALWKLLSKSNKWEYSENKVFFVETEEGRYYVQRELEDTIVNTEEGISYTFYPRFPTTKINLMILAYAGLKYNTEEFLSKCNRRSYV